MSSEQETMIVSFMSITGTDTDTARQYLEVTAWKVDEAVNLFLESGGQSNASSSAAAAPPAPQSQAAYYQEPDIRAPDPARRQRLVGGDMESFLGVRGVASFGTAPVRQIQDPFRDIAAEAGASVQPGSEKRQELSRLYQPPNDLIYHGTFNEARQFAKANKLWLLINVQDEKEFGSHQLNRDTWSDDIVQSIVGSAFVFWQNYASSEDGSRYCQLYKIQPDRLPHIGILDPRTGEKIQEITGYVEPQLMAQKLSDFCGTYSLDNPNSYRQSKPAQKPITEQSEEDQMKAAIAASLQENDDIEIDGSSDNDVEEEKAAEEICPEEPPTDAPDVTRVQIRTPDGKRLVRRISKSDPVRNLFIFLRCQGHQSFQLRLTYPQKIIVESDNTIEDERLINASLVLQN